MKEKLTREQAIRLTFYGLYLLTLTGIVLWYLSPEAREWTRAGFQWARYYRWRATYDAAPPWIQEALQVRGKGPA